MCVLLLVSTKYGFRIFSINSINPKSFFETVHFGLCVGRRLGGSRGGVGAGEPGEPGSPGSGGQASTATLLGADQPLATLHYTTLH